MTGKRSRSERPVTRRGGPLIVLVGALALLSGLPAARLGSFTPLHQIDLVFHALVGFTFFALFLVFIGVHVRETTDARAIGAWMAAVAVYSTVSEVMLPKTGVPILFVIFYLIPIAITWRFVDPPLRTTVIGLAIGVPLVGLAVTLALGNAPFDTVFTLPPYADMLCLVALVTGRPAVQGRVHGANALARRSGLFYTFGALGAGISGVYLGIGAGMMSVGRVFTITHSCVSVILVIAALVHAQSGVGVRRLLGMNEPWTRRLARWAATIALGGGAAALGFALLLHFISVRDPAPVRAPFQAASMAAPSRWLIADGRGLVPSDFQDPEACASCHQIQAGQWSVSAHRFSAGPLVRALVAEARAIRGPNAERYCLGCHAPRAILTGELQGDGHASQTSLAAGVGCVVCHTAEGEHDALGNASHVIADDPAILFERSGGYEKITDFLLKLTPRLHSMRYEKPYLESAEFCGGCHLQEQDAMLGAHAGILQDTYTSWSRSIYARPTADGRPAAGCVNCHMPRLWLSEFDEGMHDHRTFGGSASAARARGDDAMADLVDAWLRGDRAPLIAEARDGFRRHFRSGASASSAAYADGFDDKLEYLWKEKIGGLEFPGPELWPPGPLIRVGIRLETPEPGKNRLVVSLTNEGIGHDFPSAPRDLMDAWLRVEVRDADGHVILRSGEEGDDGPPATGTHRLGGDVLDAHGVPIERHRVWEIASERDNRVIPPKGTIEDEFSLPADLQAFRRPLEAQAALVYRFPGARITRAVRGDAVPLPAPAVLGQTMVAIP